MIMLGIIRVFHINTVLGSALRNLNKNQEAIQCLDAALQINPNNEIAWNNKGISIN